MDNALAFQGLRRAACRLCAWQFVSTALVAAGVAWLIAPGAAWSAVAGGMIGLLTGLYQALRMFRGDASRFPERFMKGVYAGEVVKILLTAALFIYAIRVLEAEFLPLMLGYAATLVVYWAALGTGFPWLDQEVKPPKI